MQSSLESVITERRCGTSPKSEDLIYTTAEVCNHVKTVSYTETLVSNNQGTRRHMPAAHIHLTRIAASLLVAATELTLV